MRGFLSMASYRVRVWLARRWCDPQLWEMAERYGSVLVTAERHGKVLVPMFGVTGYDTAGALAHRLHEMTKERDYWKKRAEGDSLDIQQ